MYSKYNIAVSLILEAFAAIVLVSLLLEKLGLIEPFVISTGDIMTFACIILLRIENMTIADWLSGASSADITDEHLTKGLENPYRWKVDILEDKIKKAVKIK